MREPGDLHFASSPLWVYTRHEGTLNDPLAVPADAVLRFALLPADLAVEPVLAGYGELALVAVAEWPPQAWASWTDLDPVWVNGVPRALPPGVFTPGAGPRCILRFAGPVDAAWRETLAARGWVPRFDCPPFALCADIGPDLDALRAARTTSPARLHTPSTPCSTGSRRPPIQ